MRWWRTGGGGKDPGEGRLTISPAAADDAAVRLNELTRFGQCLAFALPPAIYSDLRLWLLDGGFEPAFRIGGETRLAGVLAAELLRKRLVPPGPGGNRSDGSVTPRRATEMVLEEHRERRRVLSLRLKEMVGALNAAGIAPVLLKGSRSLWTGSPAWRDLRDIDILVPGAGQAQRCDEVLRSMGYRPLAGAAQRPTHHHLQPLYREDLPGWVEVHRRAGNRYAERLLPTATILRHLRSANDGAADVLILPEELHVLHALVHHHVGHSAQARGTVDLKGLYEFAWSLASMSPDERKELAEHAASHPSMTAMLDLWLAAAADFYHLAVPEPFAVHADAVRRWQRIRARTARPSGWKYPGYVEEIGMAMNTARLSRQPGGDRQLARLSKRIAVIGALLPPLPFGRGAP
jgi:hypothetical protein